MRSVTRALAVAGVMALVAAVGAATVAAQGDWKAPADAKNVKNPEKDSAAGKKSVETNCASCHGATGKGDGPASIALNPKPRNLTDAAYMAPLDDRYLYEIISRGGIAVGKSAQMPQFPLGSQEITNLIAYVRTLSGGAVVTSGKL